MSISPARPDRPLSIAWAVSSEHQPDAYQTYHDSIADLYDVSDVANGGKVGFKSRTRVHMFNDSALARGRSVAQTLSRGPAQIRKSGLEHISVIVNLAGTVGDCDGRDFRTDAGSVQFRDLTRPSASRVERVDTINLVTPRATVPSWLLAGDVHGLMLGGKTPGGRLVASHLLTLSDVAGGLTEAEGAAAIEAAFVIAERFLGRVTPISPMHTDAIHRTIRQRARHIIDARLMQPNLDIVAVAGAIGVSRSTLYRAFEAAGGVRTYVQHRRLDKAYGALRMRRGRSPSINEIAHQHGFKSDAHFSRAFRSRFGFPPGDVSPSPLVVRGMAVSANDPDEMDGALHDVMLDWLRAGRAA